MGINNGACHAMLLPKAERLFRNLLLLLRHRLLATSAASQHLYASPIAPQSLHSCLVWQREILSRSRTRARIISCGMPREHCLHDLPAEMSVRANVFLGLVRIAYLWTAFPHANEDPTLGYSSSGQAIHWGIRQSDEMTLRV